MGAPRSGIPSGIRRENVAREMRETLGCIKNRHPAEAQAETEHGMMVPMCTE